MLKIIKVVRDAITGRFTTKEKAKESPETTVTETITVVKEQEE